MQVFFRRYEEHVRIEGEVVDRAGHALQEGLVEDFGLTVDVFNLQPCEDAGYET